MRAHAMAMASVLAGIWVCAAACASLPAPTPADIVIPSAAACSSYPGPVLSPDGATMAWLSDGNLNLRNLATGDTQSSPTVLDALGAPPAFSPDGHAIAGPGYLDSNAVLCVVDVLAQTIVTTDIPPTCTDAFNWTAGSDKLATVCLDLTVLIFDAVHLDTAPIRVPPPALEVCRTPVNPDSGKIDAAGEQVAVVCYDGLINNYLAFWSYAGGVSREALIVQFGTPGPNPVLPFPGIDYIDQFDISPSTPFEVLVGGSSLFTADAGDHFQPTRMLSGDGSSVVKYSPDGTDVVGAIDHGYAYGLQAWHLDGSSTPYFNSGPYGFWSNFSLSNNKVLGACNSDGNFYVWHLQR